MYCAFSCCRTGYPRTGRRRSQFIPNNLQGYYFSPENLGFATPQTAEFVQYGNIPMNLYNGLLNLNIPLLDYKDPAFQLNTSIKYLSDGFKPGKTTFHSR